MGEVFEIGRREHRAIEHHTVTLYAGQWDGTKPGATRIAEELEQIAEYIKASVVAINYRIQMSRGEPSLTITIARHEDDREWAVALREGQWLVVWRNMGRIADVEVLPRDVGDDRFQKTAPVIILRGPAPEIEGD